MKKGTLFFIAVAVLCVAVLLAGLTTGKRVCMKKTYLCSSFSLDSAERTVSRADHALGFVRTAQADIIYHQEFLSSIFHPPKHIS